MQLFTMPVELGQEFRKVTIINFRDIVFEINKGKVALNDHKNKDKVAHKSKQISHFDKDLETILINFKKRLESHIIGANGDGIAELTDSRVSRDGKRFNIFNDRIDYEFQQTEKLFEQKYKEVYGLATRLRNVNDFGADPTGEKDSTEAFEKAFENGGYHVHMTEGTYKVRGIKLPSNSILSGEGKGVTTIKMNDDAPQENIVITNRDVDGTAKNITVKDFSINGNKFRQEGTLKAAGGSRSSNLRYAGVTNGYIYNIESYDALLHGIDVTYASDDYFYEGDNVRVEEQLESNFIHIDNCETYGFGDDGITTHHSKFLNITNNYSHHPTGGGNNNGIEIDDGSRYVMLSGNTTKQNFGGLEIKAHGTATAPSGVFVNNHLSIEDTRSYNVRHIGHHRAATDVKSKSAHDVVLNNITSIYPYANNTYENVTPRALVISAYDGVVCNNVTCIGDGRFQAGQPAIAVQFMSQNIVISNVNITGFKNAMADMKVFGGNNGGNKIKFANVNIHDSSVNIGIAGGAGVEGFGIYNANLTGSGKGNGIELYNHYAEIVGVDAVNYEYAADIAGNKYEVVPTYMNGGASIASTGSGAISERSAVLASSNGTFAYDKNSFVIASNMGSEAYGSRSGVINSSNSRTKKDGFAQTIMNSRSVESLGNYHFQMGYGEDEKPKASNTKFDVSAFSGNVRTAGYLKSGQDIGDIGEYFESKTGEKIENGYIVTLEGRYIRKAGPDDEPLGIVSGTAALVMGDQLFHHKSKYKKDEFGVVIKSVQMVENVDDEGNIHRELVELPVVNEDYDNQNEEDYIPRSQRDEWCVVGINGQIYTRIDETVENGDKITAMRGVGTKDNANGYYYVEEITTPYDAEKGYGVALVFVK